MKLILETIREILVTECGFEKDDVYLSSETELSPRELNKFKAIVAYRAEINPTIDFCNRRIGKTIIRIFITKNDTSLDTQEKSSTVLKAIKNFPTPIRNKNERLVAFTNVHNYTAGILGPGREVLTTETSVIHEEI